MSSSVPAIYALHHPQPKLSVGVRLIAALLSMAGLAVLIVAARLSPDPSGVETHIQLGLLPCSMLRSTGVPCIACGMTTSFSHLAHGHVVSSLIVQPAGTVFAFMTAVAVWVGGYIAFTGRPSARLLNQLPLHRGMLIILGLALVGWAYKIVVTWQMHRA